MQRLNARMLALIAPLVLFLAGVGIYAVLAYTLAQRRQEIGIRLTLGATPASVVALIIRQGMRSVLAGAAGGWCAALALGRVVSGRLVAVSPWDPAICLGIPGLLLALALLACWLPARKAAVVDPLAALRAE